MAVAGAPEPAAGMIADSFLLWFHRSRMQAPVMDVSSMIMSLCWGSWQAYIGLSCSYQSTEWYHVLLGLLLCQAWSLVCLLTEVCKTLFCATAHRQHVDG